MICVRCGGLVPDIQTRCPICGMEYDVQDMRRLEEQCREYEERDDIRENEVIRAAGKQIANMYDGMNEYDKIFRILH